MVVKETNPFCDAGFCLVVFNHSGFSQYSYATVLVILIELTGELHIWILLKRKCKPSLIKIGDAIPSESNELSP